MDQLARSDGCSSSLSRRAFLAASSSLLLFGGGTGALASPLGPTITGKCYLDVRLVQQLSEDNGYSSGTSPRGRIVFGLYGNEAPKLVEQFLGYFPAALGDGLPSYGSSIMYRMSPGKLLELGKIKGLNKIAVAGSNQLEYGGRILPSKPAFEGNDLKHDSRGLLTKYKLEGSSEFGITLGPAPELDGSWTVFGRVLEGADLLEKVEHVPIITGASTQDEGSELDSIYKAQRSAALNFGRAIGDDRAV